MASGLPEAAICVQDIDVQCVLQFTLIHAAGCALHRHTSRVIHRVELSIVILLRIHLLRATTVLGGRKNARARRAVAGRKRLIKPRLYGAPLDQRTVRDRHPTRTPLTAAAALSHATDFDRRQQ